MRSERGWALATTLVGAVVFVALAAWWIPWHPVPGGPVVATDPHTVFTDAQIARAGAYSTTARLLGYASLLVGLVVAALFGFSRVGRRLVERLPGPWVVRALLAVLVLAVIGRLVTLPFAMISHHRAVHYGLSTQGWSDWFADQGRGLGVSVVVSWLLVVVLVACARRWRRAWPVIAGGLLGALVLLGSFVYPVLVEPLFNHFTPLPDGSLRSQILRLADQEHVHVDDVLVADASRRTTTLNAYVSGYASTRRVVLYDTVVDDLPRAEILSVVAHELAHAHHDDVLTGSVLGAVGTWTSVGLLGLAVGAVRRRPGELADPAIIPLVLALVAIGTLASSPVNNGLTRQIETRADVDALETTGNAAAFERLQQQLALRSLGDPTPPAVSQWWFGSHPTSLQRIAIARRIGQEGQAQQVT
ncbi:MAG: M48 family metallopeptidase [Nocardioides sp.]